MDNAKYHNLYVEDAFPTQKSLKIELQNWLKSYHPLESDDSMLKPELYQKCRELCPKPKYILDIIAENAGHTIIRTPQYHPELQPIEICWGSSKTTVPKNVITQKLKTHLDDGFKQVTSVTLREILKKVRSEEDLYWKEDEIEDETAELLEEEVQIETYE